MPLLIITFKNQSSPQTLLGLFLMLLFPLLPPSPAFSAEPAPYWEENRITLKNLEPSELQILEETFADIRLLQPGTLKVTPPLYKKLSHFEELFGFVFNGPEIAEWVLQRIQKIEQKETWTALVNHRKGTFQIGRVFFEELTPLERMYALIHEARHSDGNGFKHIQCPEGFPFVSSRQPEMSLEKERACDSAQDGTYAFQAAFLFEIYAYGLSDPQLSGLTYNSSLTRIAP